MLIEEILLHKTLVTEWIYISLQNAWLLLFVNILVRSPPSTNTLRFPRSSRPDGFRQKGILGNVTKLTWKHLRQSLFFLITLQPSGQSLFFNKVAGLWHRFFPVNFRKLLRTPFLENTFGDGCFWFPHYSCMITILSKSSRFPMPYMSI